jgi:HPt (histidine-containing phosphotransfer) domain-containing protein
VTGPPVLDVNMIDALRALGSEPGALLEEMIQIFLLETPAALAEMTASVRAGALTAAAPPAHKLRGTSGHVGATRLARSRPSGHRR